MENFEWRQLKNFENSRKYKIELFEKIVWNYENFNVNKINQEQINKINEYLIQNNKEVQLLLHDKNIYYWSSIVWSCEILVIRKSKQYWLFNWERLVRNKVELLTHL